MRRQRYILDTTEVDERGDHEPGLIFDGEEPTGRKAELVIDSEYAILTFRMGGQRRELAFGLGFLRDLVKRVR